MRYNCLCIILCRSGVRPIQGQLQYEDFMLKFWNRSERSLVHRIVTNNFHWYACTNKYVKYEETK